MDSAGSRQIRSYVLRSGKISAAQKRSYETLFPLFGVKGDSASLIDPAELFGRDSPLTIEIGFGMGTATARIAGENPENNYLGIEVYRPGIGRLLWSVEKMSLKNIRVVEGDASEIIERRIKDNSVSAFHVFFPDPWPKKRHHKRRLITRPFTDLLASKLLPGAYIYMASDWEDYGLWALGELSATPNLKNKYDGFADAQSWRPETEFERKGIKQNHKVRELFFVKTETNNER